MEKKVYFVSGLGADERVFQYLDLPDTEKIFVHWVKPDKKDTLQSYAARLTDQIDTGSDVFLVGISFGGMIVQEISKLIHCKKVIILSSVKSDLEFSWQLKLVRSTNMHKIFPAGVLKWMNRLTAGYYFSTKTKMESDLLHKIIDDTDNYFMKWAISAIMRWDNKIPQQNMVHIHGTNDRIFPAGSLRNVTWVHNGGHFMVVKQAKLISDLINQQIKYN